MVRKYFFPFNPFLIFAQSCVSINSYRDFSFFSAVNFRLSVAPALQPPPDTVKKNRECTVPGDVAGGNDWIE